MASHGKNMLASGTGATNPTNIVCVEVVTLACAQDEAYLFEMPDVEFTDWLRFIEAVHTLYGHEGIKSLYIYVKN